MCRAAPSSAGLLWGFTGAIGGPPFPIPAADAATATATAGIQIMWNHATRYQVQYQHIHTSQFICSQGANVLALTEDLYCSFPYYYEGVTPETYNNKYFVDYFTYTQPANQAGGKANILSSTDLSKLESNTYEYLVGEGRIRQTPSDEYDIPATQANDAVNYDEISIFLGALDRYDWKLLGVKEMIVPYNNHDVFHAQPDSNSMMKQFFNPDLIRYEVHRVYVVEARLAPGKRHTMRHRVFYIDEDSWAGTMSDGWDAAGNYWRYNQLLPQFSFAAEGPAAVFIGQQIYNFQTNQYVVLGPWYDAPAPMGGTLSLDTIPQSTFDPESMAASGGLSGRARPIRFRPDRGSGNGSQRWKKNIAIQVFGNFSLSFRI